MSSTSKLLNVSIPAPKRSWFDLSRPNRSTISPGLLYPMLVEEVLPGDDIKLSVESRLKSHATLAPILGMFDCTYYHFFCPLRNYVMDMNLNLKQTDFRDEFDIPSFKIPNSLGSNMPYVLYQQNQTTGHYFVGVGSLLEYLGYPVGMSLLSSLISKNGAPNVNVSKEYNAVPILCYYDIWRNYFANPQQEDVTIAGGFVYGDGVSARQSYAYNVSDIDQIFKQLLNGDDFVTAFGDNIPFERLFNMTPTPHAATIEAINFMQTKNSHAGLLPVTFHDDMFVTRLSSSYVDYVKQQVVVDTTSGSFSIDSLRMANKLAKFIDKSLFGGTRYGQWLKSHFAVNGMEHLNIPVFLGMDRMSLFFDDVVSQSNTEQGENGFLGSTGGRASVHYPKTNDVEFYAKEHGYLITLCALRPRVEYFQGVPKMLQKTKFSDFFVPELDAVGWQPIMSKDLYANTIAAPATDDGTNLVFTEDVVGYSPAWIEYMTSVGTVHGQFASSLDYWVLLRRFATRGNENAIDVDFSTYVNPEDFNYGFAGVEDYFDNFYLNQLFTLKMGRNISKQILPSL